MGDNYKWNNVYYSECRVQFMWPSWEQAGSQAAWQPGYLRPDLATWEWERELNDKRGLARCVNGKMTLRDNFPLELRSQFMLRLHRPRTEPKRGRQVVLQDREQGIEREREGEKTNK